MGDEAVPGIERDGLDLGVERDAVAPLLAGDPQQRMQQCAADAAAAPIAQHRHAPDPALRRQSRGTDGAAAAVAGEHMPAARVEVIQLQRDRHALFLHEHALAHRAQLVERIRVVRDDDLERAEDVAHAPSPVASA